jgi:hypothetical protein
MSASPTSTSIPTGTQSALTPSSHLS